MILLIAATLATLAAPAQAPAQGAPAASDHVKAAKAVTTIKMRTIDKGAESSIDSPRQATARTAAEWAALWKAHTFDRPLPAVDFSREMVVGVFMGSRPTAGFALEIVGAADRDGTLVVTYRETTPPKGALTAQVLVAPYHLVGVPKHAGPVIFEKVA
jgi:hypothetical protein